MSASVFAERANVPDEAAVVVALGPAYSLWASLKARLGREFAPLVERWSFSGKQYGWALGLRHRDRPVLYLTPLAGGFRASLALPERAVSAAMAAELPPAMHAIVAEAPAYPEGRAVRIEVDSDEVVEGVLSLVRIRMTG
jgi:hypothetical protein